MNIDIALLFGSQILAAGGAEVICCVLITIPFLLLLSMRGRGGSGGSGGGGCGFFGCGGDGGGDGGSGCGGGCGGCGGG